MKPKQVKQKPKRKQRKKKKQPEALQNSVVKHWLSLKLDK
jgi:hypothetical protein